MKKIFLAMLILLIAGGVVQAQVSSAKTTSPATMQKEQQTKAAVKPATQETNMQKSTVANKPASVSNTNPSGEKAKAKTATEKKTTVRKHKKHKPAPKKQ
jgi:hypothetical protein